MNRGFVVSAQHLSPGGVFARDPDFGGGLLGDAVLHQLVSQRVVGIDGDNHRVLGRSERNGTLLQFRGIDLAGDHPEIDHIGQHVGHAFAGTTRRKVDAHVRMHGLELLGPLHRQGIKGKGPGNGNTA